MNRHLCTASLLFLMLAIETVSAASKVEGFLLHSGGQAFAIEPCLGGEGYWDYSAVGSFQVVSGEGPMEVRVNGNLKFTFTPTDPSLPTYEAHVNLNETLLPSSQQEGQTLFEFSTSVQMGGSDGSSVTMTGVVFWAIVTEGSSGASWSAGNPTLLECN